MKTRMPAALFPLLALPCASPGALEADPSSLDGGEIDFHNETCMDCACGDGCGLTQVMLTNTGEAALDLSLPNGFDADHLCIDGYTSSPNLSLGTLEPGEFFLLDVAVCGYLAGELNLPDEDPPRAVEGQLRFESNGEPRTLDIPYSFIPIRNQD